MAPGKVRRQPGKLRVAVIPADKARAAKDIAQIRAGQAQRAVIGGAGGQHHGVVQVLQFRHRDIAAHRNMAHEPHIIRQRHRVVTARNALD